MFKEEDGLFLKVKEEYRRQSKLLYDRYTRELEVDGINKKEIVLNMPNSVEKSILIDRLIQSNEW